MKEVCDNVPAFTDKRRVTEAKQFLEEAIRDNLFKNPAYYQKIQAATRITRSAMLKNARRRGRARLGPDHPEEVLEEEGKKDKNGKLSRDWVKTQKLLDQVKTLSRKCKIKDNNRCEDSKISPQKVNRAIIPVQVGEHEYEMPAEGPQAPSSLEEDYFDWSRDKLVYEYGKLKNKIKKRKKRNFFKRFI